MITAKPTSSVMRYMLREMFHNRLFVIPVLLSPIAALLLGTIVPFMMSNILATLARGEANTLHPTAFWLLLVTGAGGVVCNRIVFHNLMKQQAKTLERLQNMCFEHLLRKSAHFFDNRMSGKITTDTINFVESFMQLQDVLVINLLPFATNLLAGILLVSYFSLPLGVTLFGISIAAILSAIIASSRRKHLRFARQEASRKLRGYFADVITNNATVRLFANERYEKRQHAKLNEILTKKRIEDWTLITKDGNNRILIILGLQIIFLLVVTSLIKNDPSLLGVGIFAFSFSLSVSSKLFEINGMIRGYENAITNAEPMIRILTSEPEITDSRTPLPLDVNNGIIDFKDVTFWYDNPSDPLFHNLSFTIASREKIGLVGPSGGGKTTITKLLLRLADVKSGHILIDGQDIATATMHDVRRLISYVPQDPMLFHRSIKDNVRYGNLKATQKDIEQACKDANIHDFIMSLPNGYDTMVGERGVKLSGGQRQRVAIARALLKNAPLLVLDEATSALDSESEILIQEALLRLMKNKTTVVIAHRLSTIQKMDRILVLDKGTIIEDGTHTALRKKGGLYASLWTHQSGGFLQES